MPSRRSTSRSPSTLLVRLGVRNDDRLGVDGVGRPGAVTIDLGAILVGEPAPGTEAHDARLVEQEDRGSVGAERTRQPVERHVVDAFHVVRPADRLGHLVERAKLLVAPRERVGRVQRRVRAAVVRS